MCYDLLKKIQICLWGLIRCHISLNQFSIETQVVRHLIFLKLILKCLIGCNIFLILEFLARNILYVVGLGTQQVIQLKLTFTQMFKRESTNDQFLRY